MPPAVAEAAWLAHPDGRWLVLVTTRDPLRGFDRERVVERTAIDGERGPESDLGPLLSDAAHNFAATRGELELHRRERAHGLGAALRRATTRGFVPVGAELITRTASSEWAVGARAGRSAPASELTLESVPLLATLTNRGGKVHAELIDPRSRRRSTLFTVTAEVTDLGHGRRVRFDGYRIASLRLGPAERHLFVAWDTIVPIHADLAPRRGVVSVDLSRVRRELGLGAPEPVAGLDLDPS